MSTHDAIYDMSRTLRTLLQKRISLNGVEVPVTVDSPLRTNYPEPRLNLFLYQILQDEFRRNSQRVEVAGGGPDAVQFIGEPLALKLYYLVTAFAPANPQHSGGLDEHRILGKAMQVFHDNQAILATALQGSLRPEVARLRARPIQLVLLNQEVEHLKHIWGDNNVPLRASVAYEASIVFLERAEDPRKVKRVKTRHIQTVLVPYLGDVEPRQVEVGAKLTVHGANLDTPLLRVFLGDTEVKPEKVESRHMRLTVPPGLKGPLALRLQIEQYTSATAEVVIL